MVPVDFSAIGVKEEEGKADPEVYQAPGVNEEGGGSTWGLSCSRCVGGEGELRRWDWTSGSAGAASPPQRKPSPSEKKPFRPKQMNND